MSIFSYLVILIVCILCICPDLTNADAASDAAAAAAASLAAAKANIVEKFEIVNLPGWDFPMPTKMYSGYLSGSDSSRLFYIYVESEDVSPADAPITLWLNGGPGCSSLDGFWEELGPFYVDETGKHFLGLFLYLYLLSSRFHPCTNPYISSS